MTTDDLMMSRWRGPGEREHLVERVIAAEKRARVAETRCRALEEERDATTALAARVVELEDVVRRLNLRIQDLQRKKAS